MKKLTIKAISLVLLLAFFADTACYGLATLPASQNPIAKREILAALQRTQIRYAESEDAVRLLNANNASCLLLSSGKYLVTKGVAQNDLKLLRAIIHEDIEAIMQIIAKEDRYKYQGIKELILKYFPSTEGNKLPMDLYVNHTVARAFEWLILLEDHLILENEIPAQELGFFYAVTPIIKVNKHNYFTAEFWDSNQRSRIIRNALNKGMMFYQVTNNLSQTNIDGLKICEENTKRIKDVILNTVNVFKKGNPGCGRVAFILVGSSGRGETCYKSDIDYLIVHDEKLKSRDIDLLVRQVSDELAKAGFSIMSAFAVGNKDFIIKCGKCSLIERLVLSDISFVAGDQKLFEELSEDINTSFGKLTQDELDNAILNVLFIYKRFSGFSDFSSKEPDVKKGRGGVREIQNFIQIAKIRYGIKESDLPRIIDDMAKMRVVSKKESEAFKNACRFIFAVRNQIHKLTGEESDILSEQLQEAIALNFGFPNKSAFMEGYRKHGEVIRGTVKRIKRALRIEIDKRRGAVWASEFKKAEDSTLDKGAYENLLKAKDDFIRLAIAWNCTDGDILRRVFDLCIGENNRNWNIMFALAHSRNSPSYVFQKLLEFKDRGNAYRMIPREVASNPKVPEEMLKNVTSKNGFDKKTVNAAKKNLASRKKLADQPLSSILSEASAMRLKATLQQKPYDIPRLLEILKQYSAALRDVKAPKAVIFDWGGVLAESEQLGDAINHIAKKYNLNDKARQVHVSISGNVSEKEYLVWAIRSSRAALDYRSGMISPEEFWMAVGKMIRDNLSNKIKDAGACAEEIRKAWNASYNNRKDAEELVNKLKGAYYVALLSNNTKEMYESSFCLPRFDWIRNSMDWVGISYLMKCKKPDKDAFLIAINNIGSELRAEDFLFIDDDQRNITAATECGLKGVVLNEQSDSLETLPELKQLIQLAMIFESIKDALVEISNRQEAKEFKQKINEIFYDLAIFSPKFGKNFVGTGAHHYDIESVIVLLADLLYSQLRENRNYEIKYDASRLTTSQIEIIEEYVRLLQIRSSNPNSIKLRPFSSAQGSKESLIAVYCTGKDFKGEGHVDVVIPNGELKEYLLRVAGMVNIALASSNIPDNLSREDVDKYRPIMSYIKNQYKAILGEELAIPDSPEDILKVIRRIVLGLPKSLRMNTSQIEEFNRLAKAALTAA